MNKNRKPVVLKSLHQMEPQELIEATKRPTEQEFRAWAARRFGFQTEVGFMAVEDGDADAVECILNMADFAINTLKELSEKRPELIRPLAAHRDTWPALVGVRSETEAAFTQLRGSFSNSGKRIEVGPIGLGSAMFHRFNRKSKDDVVAGAAVRLLEFLRDPANEKAAELRVRHGELSFSNWTHWRQLSAWFVSRNYGPPEEKWKTMPDEWKTSLLIATSEGCFEQWLDVHCKERGLRGKAKLAERDRIEREHGSLIKQGNSVRLLLRVDLTNVAGGERTECLRAMASHKNARHAPSSPFVVVREAILKRAKLLLKPTSAK